MNVFSLGLWQMMCATLLFCITISAHAAVPCSGNGVCVPAPSLFVSKPGLEIIKQRIHSGEQPYASFNESFLRTADQLLDRQPDPFYMNDIKGIEFGWCGSSGGEDDSLKDLVDKLLAESSLARNLAVAYLLSGNVAYAEKAKEFMMAWAQNSSLVNFYEFNIDFSASTFDGMEQGFCNNSWNMALDSIWQAYGLINFSDVFLILTRNNYSLSSQEEETLRNWLRNRLLPATNAGCHAWTRWADAHTSSSVYTRYRSDNHLSWCVAGWSAAAAALNDEVIWNYAYNGGAFDDGYSGSYANPSSFKSHVGYSISSTGQVYDQTVRESEHKGLFYANFSLWALSVSAQIAEIHSGENYWSYQGHRGGSLITAYDRYAPYVAQDLPPPDPQEANDPTFYRFIYEMLVGNEWVTGSREEQYLRARNRGSRTQIISQVFGPVSLLLGDLPEASVQTARPNPPTDIQGEALP